MNPSLEHSHANRKNPEFDLPVQLHGIQHNQEICHDTDRDQFGAFVFSGQASEDQAAWESYGLRYQKGKQQSRTVKTKRSAIGRSEEHTSELQSR